MKPKIEFEYSPIDFPKANLLGNEMNKTKSGNISNALFEKAVIALCIATIIVLIVIWI